MLEYIQNVSGEKYWKDLWRNRLTVLEKETQIGKPITLLLQDRLSTQRGRIHPVLLGSWAVQATWGELTCSLWPFLVPLRALYMSSLVGQMPPQSEVHVALLLLSWKLITCVRKQLKASFSHSGVWTRVVTGIFLQKHSFFSPKNYHNVSVSSLLFNFFLSL